jgi:hypothetical protein
MLHAVLAWALCRRASLPLRALSLGRRRSVFPIYPIVVSDRLHLDIGDIVVGHFLLDGFDMLDQPVWAPDGGHVIGGGDTTARVNSDGKFEKYRPAFDGQMGPRDDSERPILEFVDSMWGVDNDWCRTQ